jgi:hypothetical protein
LLTGQVCDGEPCAQVHDAVRQSVRAACFKDLLAGAEHLTREHDVTRTERKHEGPAGVTGGKRDVGGKRDIVSGVVVGKGGDAGAPVARVEPRPHLHQPHANTAADVRATDAAIWAAKEERESINNKLTGPGKAEIDDATAIGRARDHLRE